MEAKKKKNTHYVHDTVPCRGASKELALRSHHDIDIGFQKLLIYKGIHGRIAYGYSMHTFHEVPPHCQPYKYTDVVDQIKDYNKIRCATCTF